MVTIAFRLPCALCVLSCLSACAPIAAMVGYGGSAMQMATMMDRVKLAGDGISYFGSGKTITDHAVSIVVGADCRLLNVMSSKPVCAPAQDATAGNTSSPAAVTARDDPTESDAPAAADPPYAMDGKLLAGYRAGADDLPPDP